MSIELACKQEAKTRGGRELCSTWCSHQRTFPLTANKSYSKNYFSSSCSKTGVCDEKKYIQSSQYEVQLMRYHGFFIHYQDLESSLPEPDLQPLIDELIYLKKNVFKSLPNSRLSSKTDSAAFNKASVHLSAFKVKLASFSQIWVRTVVYTFVSNRKPFWNMKNSWLRVNNGTV